jgi:flavorubredoxin
MEISACVKYVGVNDHQVDLFEGQYKVPNGMSYNSYVILDDKIAVMDTVDGFFTEEWLNNVEQVLSGKTPDYLVIQHMEPDHSASIPSPSLPISSMVSVTRSFFLYSINILMPFRSLQIFRYFSTVYFQYRLHQSLVLWYTVQAQIYV